MRSGYILVLEMNHQEKLHCKRDKEIGSIWERSNSAAVQRGEISPMMSRRTRRWGGCG